MSTVLIGQTILNQFRVESFIAAGGMGAVFRVWDLKRNAWLAMKILHADLADDPSILRKFRREANALKKLAHPNIVPFYGIYQTIDFTFLLERFVDGPSLKEILRQETDRPLPLREALIYIKSVCAALGYAHSNEVVHCDIKPGNVMVDQGGIVYLTDFGVARHAESTTTTLGAAGTPAYMAPEQIRGEAVSPATDVYALGVMLFEMLTGQRPFRGDEKETLSVGQTAGERTRFAHLHLPPPDPHHLNPAVSENLAAIILNAMAKEPKSRYKDANELWEAVVTAAEIDSELVPDRVKLPESIIREDRFGTQRFPPVPQQTPGTDRIPRLSSNLYWFFGGAVVVALLAFFGLRSLLPAVPIPVSRTPTYIQNIETAFASITSAPTITPTRPESTSTPIPITPTPSVTPTEELSWRQGNLAYIGQTGRGMAIFTLDLMESSNPILIYTSPADRLLLAPFWSPDSNQIAFFEYGGFLQAIDPVPGAIPVQLRECRDPSWLPNGSEIACRSGQRLEMIDAKSGSIINNLALDSGTLLPAISPDGNEFLYIVQDGDRYSLSRSSINDNTSIFITMDAYAPSWSPDGQWIAYQSTKSVEKSEVWIVDRFGNNARQITDTPGSYWSRAPSWSPDGQWLAYVSDRAGSIGADYGEIFITSVTTGETVQVTNTGGSVYDWRVSWGK